MAEVDFVVAGAGVQEQVVVVPSAAARGVGDLVVAIASIDPGTTRSGSGHSDGVIAITRIDDEDGVVIFDGDRRGVVTPRADVREIRAIRHGGRAALTEEDARHDNVDSADDEVAVEDHPAFGIRC